MPKAVAFPVCIGYVGNLRNQKVAFQYGSGGGGGFHFFLCINNTLNNMFFG
jgi:hypothetical protein